MAITPFLAMTASEMYCSSSLPPKVAWMACHFSPYGLGLSNLPKELPPRSLLIVDDITPPHGHDSLLIAVQLSQCVENLRCCGVLLDFQRRNNEETALIVKHLVAALPCPVAVSEHYADGLDCPVFLPPVPPSIPLLEYLDPWKEREPWLELGLDGELLTLTEQGCAVTPLSCPNLEVEGFYDQQLHCHYRIETKEKSARFTLWRTLEDLNTLLHKAGSLGITNIIGLYQELK